MKTLVNFAIRNNLVKPTTLMTAIERLWPLLSLSKRIVQSVREVYVEEAEMSPDYVAMIPKEQLCYPEQVISQYLHLTKGFGEDEDFPVEMFMPGWCPDAFKHVPPMCLCGKQAMFGSTETGWYVCSDCSVPCSKCQRPADHATWIPASNYSMLAGGYGRGEWKHYCDLCSQPERAGYPCTNCGEKTFVFRQIADWAAFDGTSCDVPCCCNSCYGELL